MPTEVILPKVDMDMSHGTLAVWHVAEGEVAFRMRVKERDVVVLNNGHAQIRA